MVRRILRSLVAEGWLIQEPDGPKYRLSLRLFHIASRPLQRTHLHAAAQVPMHQLWEATGESTYLALLDDDRLLYVANLDSTRPIRIAGAVGGRYLLHAAAPGKVLLAGAADPERLLDRLEKEGFEALTLNTLTKRPDIEKEIEQCREHGYATDLEEYADGLMCIAAPITDHTGHTVATLGQSVLTLHFDAEAMVKALLPGLLEAANAISLALGSPHASPASNQETEAKEASTS